MEQYTQMIGKNVYTVREKFGQLIVRNGNSLSDFFVDRTKNQKKYIIVEKN